MKTFRAIASILLIGLMLSAQSVWRPTPNPGDPIQLVVAGSFPQICIADHRTNQSATITAAPLTCNGATPPAGTYELKATAYVNQTGLGSITLAAAYTLPNTGAVTIGTTGLWNGSFSLGSTTAAQPPGGAGNFSQTGTKIIELDGLTTPTYTITYSPSGSFDSTVIFLKLR